MNENRPVIDALNGLLADSTVLYQKLRHYHWNVAGSNFFVLHEKFEALYDAWAASIDEIAERVLTIDGVPLHTLASMLDASRVREDDSIPAAADMVEALLADFKTVSARIGEIIELAEARGDRGTVNLMDGLLDRLEKDAWMLRAWKRETAGSWS
ncbi:MAG TPA: DNA starvation/stationary phase protection protein [Longimicrobiales bacterium]|nr:DNA starvation/stationary phase protection protein [Longimicrobiales bacterium]